jgi:hypothetical protein
MDIMHNMRYSLILILTLVFGCSTTKNKPPPSHALQKNDEFEQQVEIKEVPIDSQKELGSIVGEAKTAAKTEKKTQKKTKKSNKKETQVKESRSKDKSKSITATQTATVDYAAAPVKSEAVAPKVRLPLFEDHEGFEPGSRRPIKDPFHVNEKVVLDCNYMGASVGSLTLEVMPFVEVNNKKSYRWVGRLRTNDFFSKIFLVDDSMEVLSDYETLVPTAYRLHVKEEKQLKESRALYKSETNEATYWEKKWTEKDGDTNKKQQWIMEPFAQNYFSTLFYIRVFKYDVIGKDYMFMLSENEKNTHFKNTVIRKEKLKTDLGTFDTIVLKPQSDAEGAFKPVGDSYIWVTDDDRKMIVKIEAALKFGTLVFELKSIDLGVP